MVVYSHGSVTAVLSKVLHKPHTLDLAPHELPDEKISKQDATLCGSEIVSRRIRP